MSNEVGQLPSDYLREINSGAADGFRSLREAVREAGPIDSRTRELVLIAAFATAGYEVAVKAHTIRGLELGVSKEALIHAVLLTLGASTTLAVATRALRWIEEAAETVRGRVAS